MKLRKALAVAVVLGIVFQIGHFSEHTVQFAVWLSGQHSSAYMSPIAMYFTHHLGMLFYPGANLTRQHLMGMEIVHLVGNSLFLLTIAGIYVFFPRKCVRYALYWEGFHLIEHLSLTISAHFVNQALGMSTLWGYAESLGGHEFAVGYRVIWHFAMNLVPSALMMFPLMRTDLPNRPKSQLAEEAG